MEHDPSLDTITVPSARRSGKEYAKRFEEGRYREFERDIERIRQKHLRKKRAKVAKWAAVAFLAVTSYLLSTI